MLVEFLFRPVPAAAYGRGNPRETGRDDGRRHFVWHGPLPVQEGRRDRGGSRTESSGRVPVQEGKGLTCFLMDVL